MIEGLKPIARIAAAGLLAVGCGSQIKSVEQSQKTDYILESSNSLLAANYRITRINERFFLVGDAGYSNSSTGTLVGVALGYMRSRGCTIMDVLPANATTSKVIVENGSDCLPELK